MADENEKPKEKLDELIKLSNELAEYCDYIGELAKGNSLSSEEATRVSQLFTNIGYKSGRLGKLIGELIPETKFIFKGTAHDMWSAALNIPAGNFAWEAIGYCLQVTNRAIGHLEDDIQKGIRDKQGKFIDKINEVSTESLKAFIAHEGETRALTMLKEYLESLGIQYFIAELKASAGRSIEKQVDWTQSNADFAICLATKGKAINKRTGKHYMGLNVADELGRARQVFGNKIILLMQKGIEPHTNIREVVHESFTTTNMEKAFIKIAKELINWDFLKAGKFEENKT